MSKLPSLTSANFDAEINQDSGTVMVKFGADWCGPCKVIAPILEKIAEEAEGKFKVLDVDIDEEVELAQKFGIRSVPTILVFKEGKVVKSNLGTATKAKILSLLD